VEEWKPTHDLAAFRLVAGDAGRLAMTDGRVAGLVPGGRE
jgi:hypothetical protein